MIVSYRSVKMVGSHNSVDLTVATVETVTVPSYANMVMVQVKTQNVTMTLDGTTPTASLGFLLTAGDPAIYIPCEVGNELKFLEAADGAILEYQFLQME